MRRILMSVVVLVAALAVPLPARPAAAAGLTAVPAFGSDPGNLAMYEYVPASVRADPPVVVAMHGCTQTAADYHASSGWPKYADAYGFVLVFPEQRTANNLNRCFNWFRPGDATRGQGETLSVRQMVDSARSRHPGGAAYVTGLSGGGAMSAVLLAAYPEVFAGGSVVAGLPAGCAGDVVSAFTCMDPGVDRTPAQWRAAVRPAAAYPRVAVWHGTADSTVVPRNADELRDQWTAAHGIAATPTSTGTLPATTVETYGSGQVRVYRVAGMGHGTPVDPGGATEQCGTAGAYFLDTICSSYHTARFWGLDTGGGPGPAPTATTPPPAAATCHPGSNYEHVTAGRASTTGGSVYARGSGQPMGLYTVLTRHTLRQDPPGYYTVADAGCP